MSPTTLFACVSITTTGVAWLTYRRCAAGAAEGGEWEGGGTRLLATAELGLPRASEVERREAGGLEAVARHACRACPATPVVEQIEAEGFVVRTAGVHRQRDAKVDHLEAGAP